MGNGLAVFATVLNFFGIMLMVMHGLPRPGRDQGGDYFWGIVGLVMFALGTAMRIATLFIRFD